MRVLGLDMGTKRIGVAVSDELGIIAQAVTTIQRESNREDLRAVCNLAREYNVDEIVVGYPRHLNGTPNEEAPAYATFGENVGEKIGVPVIFWDERLTTVAAERALLEGDLRRRKRRKVIDQVAACLILESYLTWRRNREG